jgi:hypothetical protein
MKICVPGPKKVNPPLDGTIVSDDASTMEIWKRYYEKLMNESLIGTRTIYRM